MVMPTMMGMGIIRPNLKRPFDIKTPEICSKVEQGSGVCYFRGNCSAKSRSELVEGRFPLTSSGNLTESLLLEMASRWELHL